jgi:hypothetical protein
MNHISQIGVLGAAVAAITLGLLGGCKPATPPSAAVTEAESPSVPPGPPELGDIVRLFLLPEGASPNWAMLATPDSPIRWITSGVAEFKGANGGYREGIIDVVTVDGKHTTILRQVVETLPWEVEMANSSLPKFAPDTVSIRPHVDCFGTGTEGCDFEVEGTLRKGGVQFRKLCQSPPASGVVTIYEVSAPARQRAWLVHLTSGGSGGSSSSVTLHYSLQTIGVDPNEYFERECLNAR